MANHKSAKKRVLQNAKKRLHNRYYKKSARTAIKKFRSNEDPKVAQEMLPKLFSMLDKLAKRNMIHKNKANNLKSKLNKFAVGLAA